LIIFCEQNTTLKQKDPPTEVKYCQNPRGETKGGEEDANAFEMVSLYDYYPKDAGTVGLVAGEVGLKRSFNIN
jgi:hypothetical protein